MVEEDSPRNIKGMKTANKQPNEVKTGRVQNARQIRINNCVFFFLWEIERHSSLVSKRHVAHLREQNKPKEGLPP
jgi:hypothetical protein